MFLPYRFCWIDWYFGAILCSACRAFTPPGLHPLLIFKKKLSGGFQFSTNNIISYIDSICLIILTVIYFNPPFCIKIDFIKNKVNKNKAKLFHYSTHNKWLPYQILGGKTVKNALIDPQTTEIWSNKVSLRCL